MAGSSACSSSSTSPTGRVILVTGCAGFIGSHVSEALLRRGDVVVGVDELNDYYDPQIKMRNLDQLEFIATSGHFHFYKSDVDNAELLTAILERHSVTSVIHLAARAGVRPSIAAPHVYVHSNVLATVTLLQCIQRHQPRISHFVYASSSSVYGDSGASSGSDSEGEQQQPQPHRARALVESQSTDEPLSVYAASKKSCELLVSTFSHQYELLSSGLRFFTVYGPWGRVDMLPFILLDASLGGHTFQQFGDGTSSRDFTYVSDIVEGILAVHDKRRAEPGRSRQHELFNLGSCHPIQLKDYIALVERVTGRRALMEVREAQPGDVQHTFADCSKAKRMVGYEPKVSVEEGMRRMHRWYVDDYQPWRASHSLQPQQPHTRSDSRSPTSHSSTRSAASSPPRSPQRSTRTALRSPQPSPLPPGALHGLLVCTRIHCGNVSDAASFLRSSSFLAHLHSWIDHALRVAAHVAIAVDCTDGRRDVAESVEDALELIDGVERLHLVRVAPWARFIPALNALLQHATTLSGVTEIYFTSLEAQSVAHEVALMQAELRASNALLVGVRLQGHSWQLAEDGSSGSCSVGPLTGLTCPWNTNAMWSVRALARTGFLAISEDALHGGVEEVAVVAAHSLLALAGGSSPPPLATLLQFARADGSSSPSSWSTQWEDPGRRAWHEAKMASKAQRAQWQLEQIATDLTRPKLLVTHKKIELRNGRSREPLITAD